MHNNCVKYHPHPSWPWKIMVHKQIFAMCKLWPWPWWFDPESGSWCDCVMNYQDPTWQWGVMARTWIFSIYTLWSWPWRYDLGSRSWHTLESWTTIVWNIIQIQHGSEELWPGHGFSVYMQCDLHLGDMTLGQGHPTPLGHGQQLCEIFSRLDKGVRSYGPDTKWTDRRTDGQTDRQTGWFLYNPPNFVCGGYNNNCLKFYPDPTRQWGVMAWTQILGMCTLWPWPWRYDLGSR